ncbi:hypothetical protein [Aquibacillus kalidii]|uniref:hypothetical protein n=1 Tax=Aquibacillus kalidii TaxID=2762597 RepID=UPI001644ABA4|nr:hypothetical protein [Aquibacillus kalidii]
MEENKKDFKGKTKENSLEQVSVRTDLSTDHPYDTTTRYAGDSVNEHKAKESANEFFAEKEIEQVRNNL